MHVPPRSYIRLFAEWINPSHLATCGFFAYYAYDFLCLLCPQNIHGFLGLPCLIFLFLGVKIGDVLSLHIRKGVLSVCLQIGSLVPSSNMWVLSRCWLAGSLGRVVRGKTGGTVGSTSPPPPTTLIPSPNHYRQDGGGGASFVCLCSTPSAYTSVFQTLLKVFKQ